MPNRAILVAVTVLTLFAANGVAQETPEKAAQAAAEPWLALVDAAKYRRSWEELASVFREKITAEQWATGVKSVHDQLGGHISRKLKSAQFNKTLPGLPAGEYVVLTYESAFEKFKTATETVVLMKEKDGSWRVSGYFFK